MTIDLKNIKAGNLMYCSVRDSALIIGLGYLKENYSLEQVEINQDWIVSMGFDYSHSLFDCVIYRKGKYFVSYTSRDRKYIFGVKPEASKSWIPLRELKAVSQLQNAYNSLEDEELSFKTIFTVKKR